MCAAIIFHFRCQLLHDFICDHKPLSTDPSLYQVVGSHTLFAVSLTRNTTLTSPSLISIMKQNTGTSRSSLYVLIHLKLSLKSDTLQHIGIPCVCFT